MSRDTIISDIKQVQDILAMPESQKRTRRHEYLLHTTIMRLARWLPSHSKLNALAVLKQDRPELIADFLISVESANL